MEVENLHDVIIVGAGISGLTAAYYLRQKKPDWNVFILEAKNRIGGRTVSQEIKTAEGTDKFDMGGTWVGPAQEHIMGLLKELNLETYPQYFEGRKYLQIGKQMKVTSYAGSLPSMGLLSLLDVDKLIKQCDNEQKKVAIESPNAAPNAEKLDTQTVESYIQSKSWTYSSVDLVRVALRTVYGVDAGRISALYLMATANSSGGFMNLLESGSESAQGHKIKGGSHQICDRLLEAVGEDKIALNSPISKITQDDTHVEVTTVNGKSYKATNVILAIPPHLLTHVTFEPALPSSKVEFLNSISPGHLIKIYITYKTQFWREMGFSGEIVTNGGPSHLEGCSTGPLGVVFDGTNSNDSPALVGFIGGKQATEYACKTKEERQEAVLRSLESFFPADKVRDYVAYVEKNWQDEPYNGGCPQDIVPPGMACIMNEGLRTPFKRVYFASTEAATKDVGFMSGAVESASTTVNDLLSRTDQE